jgi:hypothetical protein
MSLKSELLRSRTNCRPQQNPLLQKPSEKGVERREIVQEIPDINNKQQKMEVLLPEAGMMETKMKPDLEYTCRALPKIILGF